MKRARSFAIPLLMLLVVGLAMPARAVLPDERLADPLLEGRARALSQELRCLVCQNQSIDDSNADLAHDLRVLVRERLKAGDSDSQVIDFIVARYGEFVLLKPRFSLRNALLWSAPAVMLLGGGIFILLAARRRKVRHHPRVRPGGRQGHQAPLRHHLACFGAFPGAHRHREGRPECRRCPRRNWPAVLRRPFPGPLCRQAGPGGPSSSATCRHRCCCPRSVLADHLAHFAGR